MQGIMADLNFEGHLQRLVYLLQEESRADIWTSLQVKLIPFEAIGLPRTAIDRLVWQACQRDEIVLITRNRNRDDEDSLEATIADLCTATSLPVIDVHSADRVMTDRTYAERVADGLLEYLFDLRHNSSLLLGTGRLPLPKP